MAEREKGCSVENLHLVAEKGLSNLEEAIAVSICRLSGGNSAFHGRDSDPPPNNGIPAAETVACISPFLRPLKNKEVEGRGVLRIKRREGKGWR